MADCLRTDGKIPVVRSAIVQKAGSDLQRAIGRCADGIVEACRFIDVASADGNAENPAIRTRGIDSLAGLCRLRATGS